MPKKNPEVDAYLAGAKKWQPEMKKLRSIILQFPLNEEFKWGKPCYSLDGANVVLIVPFKQHCVLLMCRGALLKDPAKILVKPTENTQGVRQIRFANLKEILNLQDVLNGYFLEAIEVEKAGLDVTYKKITDFPLPEELKARLDKDPALKKAFHALTPGRQRGYLLHFSAAKQAKTREARIDKCAPRILRGKGLND